MVSDSIRVPCGCVRDYLPCDLWSMTDLRPLLYLGRISYGLYIYHVVVLTPG